jgi:hypothetical protein
MDSEFRKRLRRDIDEVVECREFFSCFLRHNMADAVPWIFHISLKSVKYVNMRFGV